MKRKTIIIILIIALLTVSFGYYYYHKSSNGTTDSTNVSTTIDYDENDVDFSTYETTNINLDTITDKLSITKKGVYHLTGSLTGYIEVSTEDNVEIILDNVTITNSTGPCINIISAKNTYLSLTGTNTLTDGANYSGFSEENGCIYSKDDLFITGDGTLNLTANYQDGIVSKDDLVIKSGTLNITSKDDGIRGTDSVVIENGNITIIAGGDGIKSTKENDSTKGYVLIKSGTINITSVLDGIQASTNLEIDSATINIITSNTNTSSESSKGLKATNSILIKDINLSVTSTDDAIHSNNVIEIQNGTMSLSSGDDGIHADASIIINSGTINIKKSYEGIEAHKITINGGTINLYATDDGININGGSSNANPMSVSGVVNNDYILTINGGTLYVNAGGDGLDSNGSIKMTGGTVYVDGPTDNGNGAIDYNDTFEISGGTLIASGSSGMAQNTSSGSSQNSVLIYFTSTQSAGTKVTVGDITYSPSKAFSSLVVSSPNLTKNNSYTISLNGTTYKTFTISSVTTTVGSSSSSQGQMRGR